MRAEKARAICAGLGVLFVYSVVCFMAGVIVTAYAS